MGLNVRATPHGAVPGNTTQASLEATIGQRQNMIPAVNSRKFLDFSMLSTLANNNTGIASVPFGTPLGRTGKTPQTSQINDLDYFISVRPNMFAKSDQFKPYRCFSDYLLIAIDLRSRLDVPGLFVSLMEVIEHSYQDKTQFILPPERPAAVSNPKAPAWPTIATTYQSWDSIVYSINGQTPSIPIIHTWNLHYINIAFDQLVHAVAVQHVVETTSSHRLIGAVLETGTLRCQTDQEFYNTFLAINTHADVEDHQLFIPPYDHDRKVGFQGPRTLWDSLLIPNSMAQGLGRIHNLGNYDNKARQRADEKSRARNAQFRINHPDITALVDTLDQRMPGYELGPIEDDPILVQPMHAYINLAGIATYAHKVPRLEDSTRVTCVANVTKPRIGDRLMINLFGVICRVPSGRIWSNLDGNGQDTATLLISFNARIGHGVLGNHKVPAVRASHTPLHTHQRPVTSMDVTTASSHQFKMTQIIGATSIVPFMSLISRKVSSVRVLDMGMEFTPPQRDTSNYMKVEVKVIGDGQFTSLLAVSRDFWNFRYLLVLQRMYQQHRLLNRPEVNGYQQRNWDTINPLTMHTEQIKLPCGIAATDLVNPNLIPGTKHAIWRCAQASLLVAMSNKHKAVDRTTMRIPIIMGEGEAIDLGFLFHVRQREENQVVRLENQVYQLMASVAASLGGNPPPPPSTAIPTGPTVAPRSSSKRGGNGKRRMNDGVLEVTAAQT